MNKQFDDEMKWNEEEDEKEENCWNYKIINLIKSYKKKGGWWLLWLWWK